MIAETVRLRDFRSYERLELALQPGLVLVVGANGVGKTNLLEAVHIATQGFSPRTRTDSQVVRFGAEGARAAVAGRRGEVGLELEVTVRRGEGKRARLNGAPLRAAEQLRSLVATLVFTPDRLGVVKGPPAARRAYFDRVLGRFAPAQAPLPTEYAAAVAQRNAALRRVSAGVSGRDAVEPWSDRVATLGAELVAARLEALALLELPLAARADELGLGEVSLRYDGEPPTPEGLAAGLERDLERGVTSLGPHLDDVVISAGERDLRSFGSQGEQRLALLALLLAESETIADRTGVPPLLLLDDVLSELDPNRRRILAARVRSAGQALVTATDAAMLPAAPDQLLEVTPGTVLETAA
ncbi:MAG TPA: DNA replication and repair protein RecF [Gaiellaceae bacterium]|nr:DNA replication and repair protein RecF [Gaiellaceae bacterium]